MRNIMFNSLLRSSSSLLSGLMGYWKLDESSGTIYDAHSTGVNSTRQSVTYGVSGKKNTALSFNGTSNYVEFGRVCRPTTGLSASLWIKTTNTEADRHILCNYCYDWYEGSNQWHGWSITATDSNCFYVTLFDGNPAHELWSSSFGSGTYNNGNWHHIVLTWNGTNAYVYYDNSKSSAIYWPYTLSYKYLCDLHFCSNEDHSDGFLSCSLDEVGIWNRALTDAEVATLYNSGNGKSYSFN